MEFEFPKYPFVWDYYDQYNLFDYKSVQIDIEQLKHNENLTIFDEHLIYLESKFPKYKIIHSIQTVKSRNLIQNLNIHTWYLSQLKVFEQTETNIKIMTNSRFKYKSKVKCFIYDPANILVNMEIKKTNNENIAIIKNKNSIIPKLIPLLYIHVHNIKGIFRFSPNDNNKINLSDGINNGTFYIVLDKLIVRLDINIL
jgi:hypothetical protein